MIKKVGIRIVAVIGMFFLFNLLYVQLFFPSDLEEHGDVYLVTKELPDSMDVVYLGESSNKSFHEDDLDKRFISDLIADQFTDLKVVDLTKEAAHAGIYKKMLNWIAENKEVKTVVVTMNMRSFNADWIYSELETPLQKSAIFLNNYPPIINRLILSFKGYDIKTIEERQKQVLEKWEEDIYTTPYFPFEDVRDWDRWMDYTGIKNPDGSRNVEKTQLACHYIKTFGFELDTLTNPRIQDFDEIIQLAKKNNWNLVFNLLAENTEKADKLVGDRLTQLMKRNRDILLKYYGKKDVTIVDNLEVVPDREFIDQDWTTEHYAESGRKTISRKVAASLAKFYPDSYSPKDFDNQYEFYNDFERENKWEQGARSSTDEFSFEKEKSSIAGGKFHYSVTFEYELERIPESKRKEVYVSFMYLQRNQSHDAHIVFECESENFPKQQLSEKIETDKIDEWVKVEQLYRIPEGFKDFGHMKVYVHNPTEEPVYIDNMSIKFR